MWLYTFVLLVNLPEDDDLSPKHAGEMTYADIGDFISILCECRCIWMIVVTFSGTKNIKRGLTIQSTVLIMLTCTSR